VIGTFGGVYSPTTLFCGFTGTGVTTGVGFGVIGA
jgi:hypothetical protein